MKKAIVFFVLLVAVLLLFGCTGNKTTTQDTTASGTGQQGNLDSLKSLSDDVSANNDSVSTVDPDADISSGVE